MKATTIVLDPEFDQLLTRAARERGVSRAEFIRQQLALVLEQYRRHPKRRSAGPRPRLHEMMTRVQILLPEDQARRLEALAARRRESKGEVIRRALDLLLRTESAEEEPLLDLIGQAGRSRRPDVSGRHDLVLADSERARVRRR